MPTNEAAQRRPPHPVDRQFSNRSSSRRRSVVSKPGRRPATMPTDAQASNAPPAARLPWAWTGKIGPAPSSGTRSATATTAATATGMKLRGFHSKSSSSTASSTAATGVPKMAVMPPAAPATSSVLRSAAGEVEALGEERADRAAGHDDRAFGAERAAGADGDGGRERLEDGDFRLDPAAADQDGLDRLGDAVAANLLRAVARHQADDQAADDGHEHDPIAKAMLVRRLKNRREMLIESQIGDHSDEPDQHLGDESAEHADDCAMTDSTITRLSW